MKRLSPQPTGDRAMAILIVLGAVVLISILTVAFFGSVTKELTASKSHSSGVSARIHADAAANIVIAQLRAGTTEDDATKTWISQPGLIRQFDSKGDQDNIFKLYSSNRMVEGGTFSPLAAGGEPADVPPWSANDPADQLPWNLNPGVYTDLNSPVVANAKPKYPILNPGGLNADSRIQGFNVAQKYALPDTLDFDADGDTAEVGQIPMPVRWIYILTDGQLATAEPDTAKTVRLVTANGAAVEAANPPVGRVAFWADDDTCRLNINTASEGLFWNIPVAPAADDAQTGGQITPREYQRYPGHPSTTSLSPAFSCLFTEAQNKTLNKQDLRNFIFSLTPRVSGRGSQFGSRTVGATMPVNNDNDRLFPSVDDLLFLPNVKVADGTRYVSSSSNMQTLRSDQLDWIYTGTDKQMTGKPYQFGSEIVIDPARLDLMRFFLTADSRAPEVNLFGKPRVSLWPVDTRAAYRSVYDELLMFCSTLGNSKYYFQRQNPNSSTEDYSNIARNQELIGYLDRLTSTEIPGEGGSFSTKYGNPDRLQTITSIFDWVRCVNLAYRDKSGSVQPYAWLPNSAASGTVKPPGLAGSGQVIPIKINSTRGYGRIATLSKAALAIVREAESAPVDGKVTLSYRVVFLMETYVPMLGYAGYIPNYSLEVEGLNGNFEFITDQSPTPIPVTMANGTIDVTAPANIETFFGRAWGGTQGFNNLFTYIDDTNGLTARTLGSSSRKTGYPFVSGPISVVCKVADKNKVKVGLQVAGGGAGGNVTIRMDAAGEEMGSYTVGFPSFGPLAGAFLGTSKSSNDNKVPGPDSGLKPKIEDRMAQLVAACNITVGDDDEAWRVDKTVVGSPDVIRGVELEHGDLRLSALHGTRIENTFVPHRDYKDPAYPQAHSLQRSAGSIDGGLDVGKTETSTKTIRRGLLAAGTSYTSTAMNYTPQAPSKMTAASGAGDFSTGLGSEADGPHILKADEGNSSVGGMNWGMSKQYPYENQFFPYDNRLSDLFSPNRQVVSAVQLGTLPSRAASDKPWLTLLFRPLTSGTHIGANSPPDYMLLDLFWMPVIDPYPISEPLSTAGKVNMNYQMAPFTYIERSSALLGALKPTRITAIPKEHAKWYKWTGYAAEASKNRPKISYLYELDEEKTLLFFQERFANPASNVFRSAAEICSIPLAPKQNTKSPVATGHADNVPEAKIGSTNISGASDATALRAAINDFWDKNTLSGDNVREAPYNSLYPRLTTQSNTFTVYVRAQALQVTGLSGAGRFSEVKDRVIGEYRGSYAVERYINPADTTIPDFTTAANLNKTIYPYYKFRVRSAKQFVP